jgi:hypothetical protein
LEDPGVNGRIILRWVLQNMKACTRFIWPHLAQDMSKRRAVVNMIMKLRIPYNGNFLVPCSIRLTDWYFRPPHPSYLIRYLQIPRRTWSILLYVVQSKLQND